MVVDTLNDWPEDFSHENGNYMCTCAHCGCTFHGHKRRVCCKACATKPSHTLNDCREAFEKHYAVSKLLSSRKSIAWCAWEACWNLRQGEMIAEKALEEAARIVLNLKPEMKRDKAEEWEACYAALFRQLNDVCNQKRE